MAHILVTGGAGFMGSYFIKYMFRHHPYISITNVDALTYAGNLSNLAEVSEYEHYTFYQANILDREKVEKIIQEQSIDTIVHFAAETHVDRSLIDPMQAVKTNVIGTGNMLELATKYNLAMIHISTDEVFGSVQDPVDEQAPFHPSSPYSAGKAGGDLLCESYYRSYGTKVTVTHACNIFGPYQYPEKIIPLFVTNLLEEKSVPVYGDGLNVREWMYVEDHSRAIEHLLEHGQYGEVYNIGTGYHKSNLELTHHILEAFGYDESWMSYHEDRKGHDRRYALDSSKLRDLGWEPLYEFEDSLYYVIDWYKENADWWQPLRQGAHEYYKQQYKNQ